MKIITSIKRTLLCSLVLLVASFGLLFTVPNALAASVNPEFTQYLTSDVTAPGETDVETIDAAIKYLRSAKLNISKLVDLPIETRKELLTQINGEINELIKQKKALSEAA